ncbi:hypothetical protein N9K95_03670 [Schleiferiaceae bacterium]|nr:hypothetical protein [Schleiferiaceae bacterium]
MTIQFDTNIETDNRTLNAIVFYESKFDPSLKSFIHHLIIITNGAEAFYRMEGSDAENAALFMTESNYPETLEYEKRENELVHVDRELPEDSKAFRDTVTNLLETYLSYDEFNFAWKVADNAFEDNRSDFKVPEKFLRRIQRFNWPDDY